MMRCKKRSERLSIIPLGICAVSLLKQIALKWCAERERTSFSPPVINRISPLLGSCASPNTYSSDFSPPYRNLSLLFGRYILTKSL